MTTLWSAYLPFVRSLVSQCPDPALEIAVREAAARLCVDSMLIRSTLTAIDATVGDDTYTLTPPTDTYIVATINLLYNGKKIFPKTEEELDAQDYGWRTADNSDGIQSFFESTPGTITLNRKPATLVTDGIVARVATQPDEACTGGDDLLFREYRQFIAHGAAEALKRQKGKAWSDDKGAIYHAAQFNFGIQRAKSRALMGNTIKSTRIKIPSI